MESGGGNVSCDMTFVQRADGKKEFVNSAEGRALQEERTAAPMWQCSWCFCGATWRRGALGPWGSVSDEGGW